ncbi:MAG: AMP-binding acetyl-CoA synthetase [Burkholderiales bacterium]|nr:MAG: AMP-binding acetyl-CoA synthetase [Burkholderiales bacterium]
MDVPNKLILDYALEHGETKAERIYLTQPVGGDGVVDYTWGQVIDQSRRMAAYLRSRGFEPGARIAVLSKNCAHFIMAELAIWMAGYTTVAIFPTETADTVRFVLEHSEASLLFVGKLDDWPRQRRGVPEGLPCIALPLAPTADFDNWDAILAAEQPIPGRPQRRADDIAMILYTSGSTGTPKGVMTSFAGITRAAEGIGMHTRAVVGRDLDHRTLSYLPLAHCYERSWVEAASLMNGRNRLYFVESLDTFLRDLRRARPTTFLSVPRLWAKFQQSVFEQMPPAKLDRLLRIPVVRGVVARKVREGLGLDHVIVAGSGAAPIPPDLIAWYRRIGLRLHEGYAMTEDAAYSHSSTSARNEPGYVGVALPGVQVRISDEGEILVRSPARMVGYYKRPDLDAQSFTEDGFFRTGDLGELRADGLLKITGRAKELFKIAKGKYVAPAPIENRLNAHPMVELSLVAGAGQPGPCAIVQLDESLRPRLADPALRMRVQGELERLLDEVNAQLPDYERLRTLVVAIEPWSIENGFLTPTMKLRRARIEAAVQPQVAQWYESGRKVQWADGDAASTERLRGGAVSA